MIPAVRSILGESPLYSRARDAIIWVDTYGGKLHFLHPVSHSYRCIDVPSPIGFVAEDTNGRLLTGIGCEIWLLNNHDRLERLTVCPAAREGYRLNDARFDVAGRLWIGLIDERLTPGSGQLFRYDADGSWHDIDGDFTLINGLDWSLDGRSLYVTESHGGTIYAYDFDPATGRAASKRNVFSVNPAEGKPDGLLVEPSSCLLSVLFDGAAILRITPDGRIAKRYALPVPRPTSCAFSADYDTLFVTSATLGLSESSLAACPLSGSLLALPWP
ncbi:SMP-30/gluconolactonase/LRE family protein [Winslowiella iniecta]|uniref:SMP-30/gluconolactonase/LRE family protein n=1 Tax=Winslowiella iniecta TaxID=1560201 RepID=UPI00092D40C0|nr:SMP-30/gluconolactonase/LRE family protein [Winslowiella iniecta]